MRKLKLTELGRVGIEEYKSIVKLPVIVILDNIRSAMNVGSVFRTADAMAIERVYLCGISATPPNKEITKTAIGATDSVEWTYKKNVTDAIKEVKDQGYAVYGVEQTDDSVELMSWNTPEKVAIIMGNEVKGVSDESLTLCDGAIEIAQYGTKHSLNVSVCTGIVLHHICSHLRRT